MESSTQPLNQDPENRKTKPLVSPQLIELIDDAILLTKYSINTNRSNNPEILERLLVLQNLSVQGALSPEEITEVVQLYDEISTLTLPVTADSLRETYNINKGYWRSRAGRHLLTLWSITFFVGLLIFLYAMLEYRVSYFDLKPSEEIVDSHLFWVRLQHYSTFLIPFTYGALGACAFLLRKIGNDLKSREFDYSSIPQHWNRLFLGALSGGLIVMFINQMPDSGGTIVKISEGVLGFLAGYSIEFLFNTLDRILTAILPSSNKETIQSESLVIQKKNKLVNRLLTKLSRTEDPTERKIIESTIKDLR
ncbi:MAG: hypothetical protein GXP14_06185 [Gammaproteobacteria bacterium]|nr:hypothetical protein [Gammaproteobacteria bacterium]